MSRIIASFQSLLSKGQDNALLRFGLGQAYLAENRPDAAEAHLSKAVEHDPLYSAAWKLLGKARTAMQDHEGAMQAYREGIQAAERRGDKQAAKEMGVFLRRLEKSTGK